ncbi:hypothetical protein TNCV_2229121 [Trichonephila clavipes]|nr:hypothetical protein TNCV_2229121 [Trichonephila clavipes]
MTIEQAGVVSNRAKPVEVYTQKVMFGGQVKTGNVLGSQKVPWDRIQGSWCSMSLQLICQYNESDAIDIDQCDNEIESEEEFNKIEFRQLAEELRSKYRKEVENRHTSIPMTKIHTSDTSKNCQVQESYNRNR